MKQATVVRHVQHANVYALLLGRRTKRVTMSTDAATEAYKDLRVGITPEVSVS